MGNEDKTVSMDYVSKSLAKKEEIERELQWDFESRESSGVFLVWGFFHVQNERNLSMFIDRIEGAS